MKNKYLLILIFCTFSIYSNAQQPWWNNTVAYEIFVRSFYDTNADGRGDFKGLTQKLDYLNDGNPNTNNDLGVGFVCAFIPILLDGSGSTLSIISSLKIVLQDESDNNSFI